MSIFLYSGYRKQIRFGPHGCGTRQSYPNTRDMVTGSSFRLPWMSESVYTERCARFAGYAVKIGLNSHLRKHPEGLLSSLKGSRLWLLRSSALSSEKAESEVPSVCG
jgi:hypothetical protein